MRISSSSRHYKKSHRIAKVFTELVLYHAEIGSARSLEREKGVGCVIKQLSKGQEIIPS